METTRQNGKMVTTKKNRDYRLGPRLSDPAQRMACKPHPAEGLSGNLGFHRPARGERIGVKVIKDRSP